MSKFDYKSSMLRYRILAWIMCLIAVVIVCRAGYIMTAKRDYWIQVSDRLKADSVPVKPTRGNILSTDRQLLASSLPEYMLFVDFKTMRETQTDTLWEEKEDSICYGLNQIFPQVSAEEFRRHLREGVRSRAATGESSTSVSAMMSFARCASCRYSACRSSAAVSAMKSSMPVRVLMDCLRREPLVRCTV